MLTNQTPPQTAPSPVEKCWQNYTQALAEIHAHATDINQIKAKKALGLFILWLDAFHGAGQPRRIHHIVRNAILRANVMGLDIVDAHKAISDNLEITDEEWESAA